ncbi:MULTISPECIES: hypothetical protein [unclassified Streptomyces]|uniref:hypothetical protein n=1 Tax=Streptomyces TaxID=1883 RepID=UPI00136D20D5|nr:MULTISPECIES: hypothetical protein [unclassified Streptomyces]NEA03744.1 hypothetical protein [Streptomyces sp. SID10116]MYY84377.1 hypothetical protein [Streptomyces sp. SID335]MYZ19023.1 hypothetical protein [Streptomyces sp. SID337]NDZ89435.1 hypothetical protein [Streptomyces sp. SID10115]NDZ90192.1 hypothetical protein [Streptomyces sp. SID10115]
MSSPKACAIAAMFTSALGAIRENETPERIRIEAEVTAALGETSRLELLQFLTGTADRFGHSINKDGTSLIWAEVDREDP